MTKAADKSTPVVVWEGPGSREPQTPPERSLTEEWQRRGQELRRTLLTGAAFLRGLSTPLNLPEPSAGEPVASPDQCGARQLAVHKLSGKEWVVGAYARRADELRGMTITEAGEALSVQSQTAPDCAKPLSVGHCINLLRDLNVFPKKPRNPP